MFCPSCGKTNPDGSRFCMGCGGTLTASAAAPPRPALQRDAAGPAPMQTAPAPAYAPPPAVQRPYGGQGAAAAGGGPARTSAAAVWSVILAFVPICLTQIAGLILGIVALSKIKGSGGRLRGGGLAITGIVVSAVFGLVLLVMLPAVAIAIPGLLAARTAANEANIRGAMRQIVAAQMQFREADRDGNTAMDYWTADVAGLYGVEAGGAPIALIEAEIASADDAPVGASPGPRVPYRGYWFRALRNDPEGNLYAQDPDSNGQMTTHPYRFAVVAFPAEWPTSGRKSFLVDESGTVYEQDLGGSPPGDSHPGYDYPGWMAGW